MRNEHKNSDTKKLLKDKLMKIILLESSKSYENMDDALIIECVDFLMELEGEKRLSKEQINEKITEIPFGTAATKPAKKKASLKMFVLIAAVLAVLFSLFCVGTISMGDKDEVLYYRFMSIIEELIPGESFEADGVSFIISDETRQYASIEELLKEEELSLLYPAWMPENEKIDCVGYELDGDKEVYSYLFGRPDCYNFSVDMNRKLSDEIKSGCEVKSVSSYMVYFTYGDTFVQAMFEYEGNCYALTAKTEEEAIKIIENLKEIE